MRKLLTLLVLLAVLAACAPSRATPVPVTPTSAPAQQPSATTAPTATTAATPTSAPTATIVPTATPTGPQTPPEGYGPANFPAGVNPLTGLVASDPTRLERRPVIIKVENLPRNHRPQWGLSKADNVYEYYTEFGTTRFAAVFYGQDTDKVGPIRSARWFDIHLIRAYKAVFAFGSAYADLFSKLANAEFSDRLVLEAVGNCPPMCRFEPNGVNFLLASTADLGPYAVKRGADNNRQNLDGLHFNAALPAGGQPASDVFTRFSAAIYNHWGYQAASGRYLRYVDQADDPNRQLEDYQPLTDRATGEIIAADNVVVLLAPYKYLVKNDTAEVLDIEFTGSGTAYAFRDGQAFKLTWTRSAGDKLPSFTTEDGQPYALKPGSTWFEMMGAYSALTQNELGWRFVMSIP